MSQNAFFSWQILIKTKTQICFSKEFDLYKKTSKWEKGDFGQAMVNAVYRHAPQKHIKYIGNKLTFNGFWRNGEKRNVCIWPEQAAWSDLCKPESSYSDVNKGGVGSFAKTVFNMELKEFMEQYGNAPQKIIHPKKTDRKFSTDYADKIWSTLLKRDHNRPDVAAHWLINSRKMQKPNLFIGSGFANLYHEDVELFAEEHRKLIENRIVLGKNIVVPLRGIENDKAQNLFIRTISEVPKEEKSRLLTGCGGWTGKDSNPRAFGFPHLIHDFPHLIICEGMADYFATECLLDADEKYLPIGAPGTAAINKWASWLSETRYQGKIHLIYQMDTDHKGGLTTYGPGQKAAIKAKRILCSAGLSAHLFNWTFFLQHVSNWQKAPRDLADVFVCSDTHQDMLSVIFLNTLTKTRIENDNF
jgi:hypothetical protein